MTLIRNSAIGVGGQEVARWLQIVTMYCMLAFQLQQLFIAADNEAKCNKEKSEKHQDLSVFPQ